MSYDLCWYDESRQILLVTFGEGITYDVLYQLYEDCASMLDTVSHPVILIHDLSHLKVVFKIDIASMAKLPRMRIIQHPNWLLSYFANPKGQSKIVLDVVSRLFPTMMRSVLTVASVDEAFARAREKLAALPPSPNLAP
ncbi:MAG: hypothetical protein SNJ80_15495 [Anaerolinea sp.]